ncbi:MAG: GntR family transcriptional regulator [Lachnospiraceae bacterium]|nr:GntR family transcriptional regulator [Lachnospiraceae bacterium]
MQIIINNSSMKPIYEQIEEQIKANILNKTLLEDTPLPSVRVLARELRVSALTVKKAYDTLEQEGFVITVHGKGSYVARTGASLRQEEFRKEIESDLEKVVRKARSGQMTNGELKELMDLIMEEL